MENVKMYRCLDCQRTVPVADGDSTQCPYCGHLMYPCH